MSKWKPEWDERYYIPCVCAGKGSFRWCRWINAEFDYLRYEAGIICESKKEAIEMAKKMLMVAKDSPVNSRDNPLTAYRYVYDNGRIKCPNCSKEFVWGYYDGDGYDEINYCPYCGQRINVVDTEDNEEESHE